MAKRYSLEFRQRAVRLVNDRLAEGGVTEYQAIKQIAPKLGVSIETLRRWYLNAETDTGKGGSDSEELRRLRRENAELRKVNELLKAASAFFASELDHPGMK